MSSQETNSLLVLAGEVTEKSEPLWSYLRQTSGTRVEVHQGARLPDDLGGYGVLILVDPPGFSAQEQERLVSYVKKGGGCLALLSPSSEPLPPMFGVQAGPSGPWAEIRLRFADREHLIGRRFPDSFFLHGYFRPLELLGGDVQPVLNTVWQYREACLAAMREEGRGRVCCMTLQAWAEPYFQQLVHRLVRHLSGKQEPRTVGVAVVGYGSTGSIGNLHGLAAQQVPGLDLRAVCDTDEARLQLARQDFPDVTTYTSIKELARDDSVDLAIVATPPNTHADLVIQLLRDGKHVACEKPLCLTVEEAHAMTRASEESGRVLTCNQNRRWDIDYLAIQQALRDGLIGDPFYLETFVGGFSHPCDFWHSHQPVSGGTLYDWGAHYIDWILNLFPGPTKSVIGTSHKRVWHDVTNADQVRAQIRFADGREAEFLHSDVAALGKPKWYLLGTEGAIVGHWNEATLLEPDPITYFKEQRVPTTEIVPLLSLYQRHPSGNAVAQQLSLPERRPLPFHLSLADHLLTGEPLAVTPQSAARVVAVLEAATRSAERDGAPEALCV